MRTGPSCDRGETGRHGETTAVSRRAAAPTHRFGAWHDPCFATPGRASVREHDRSHTFSATTTEYSVNHENVTCPFCGLTCDDLSVSSEDGVLTVLANGCERSRVGFGDDPAALASVRAQVDGIACDFETAYDSAAGVLGGARRPLFAGLGTDVAGMRQIMSLADRLGGVVDHRYGDALLRNTRVLQDYGWMTTTLGEVRNRADLIVVLGAGTLARAPRFLERMVNNRQSLFRTTPPSLIVLGGEQPPPPSEELDATRYQFIPAPLTALADVLSVLRCKLAQRPWQPRRVAGLEPARLDELLAQMRRASYGVIVWSAGEFDFPNAELTIQTLTELVKELNRDQRFAALHIGAGDGDTTAYQVCTWQTGYPLRCDFATGHPVYDPQHLATARLLQTNEADALLWVSAFERDSAVPAATLPTVVLGRPGLRAPDDCKVFIPVATPGLDHDGVIFRCDATVALPLRRLRSVQLPSAAEALHAIAARLSTTP